MHLCLQLGVDCALRDAVANHLISGKTLRPRLIDRSRLECWSMPRLNHTKQKGIPQVPVLLNLVYLSVVDALYFTR